MKMGAVKSWLVRRGLLTGSAAMVLTAVSRSAETTQKQYSSDPKPYGHSGAIRNCHAGLIWTNLALKGNSAMENYRVTCGLLIGIGVMLLSSSASFAATITVHVTAAFTQAASVAGKEEPLIIDKNGTVKHKIFMGLPEEIPVITCRIESKDSQTSAPGRNLDCGGAGQTAVHTAKGERGFENKIKLPDDLLHAVEGGADSSLVMDVTYL
jgi:hypothetical protein